MFKFHEMRSQETAYFQTMVKYCKEMFHCLPEDIDSLVGKMLVGKDGEIKAHIIYAEALGEMVGFTIFYYYPKNKVGFLEALVVFDEYRNLGIGSQLYWMMVDYLKGHHPGCTGHLLEMCQDKKDYLKRKAFFLKQGCIPVDLEFFFDHNVKELGLQLLYHPYRLDQAYSLKTMENILREMSSDSTH